jgi:hypothetical protein
MLQIFRETFMKLDLRLVEATKAFINSRFPSEGWAGAAGMYPKHGDIHISTAPEIENAYILKNLKS